LKAGAPASGASPSAAAIAAHMNQHFGVYNLSPAEYYINPAKFFITPLETYGWNNSFWLNVDSDFNGYPDKVVRAGASAPVDYNLYAMDSIPASGPHFWQDSREV